MIYNLPDVFEWDESKAESNFCKHGVRFSVAITVWQDPGLLEMIDTRFLDKEERCILIGHSSLTRLLVVVYCDLFEGRRARIISARKATRNERQQYFSRLNP